MRRKYDTLIHSPADYSGKQESAEYSSKQNNGKSDMGIGEAHSLLAMCASAEKQTFDHDCYRGRTRGEFSNYGTS